LKLCSVLSFREGSTLKFCYIMETAQLLQRDRATRYVSWNPVVHNCTRNRIWKRLQ